MKITVTLDTILQAFGSRTLPSGEKCATSIDALNLMPLNALASNRANVAKRKTKLIVDAYLETVNKKQTEKNLLSVDVTEKYQRLITEYREENGQDADITDLDNQLNTEIFDIGHKIDNELKELLKEEYTFDIYQIKMSDFKVDPTGNNDDPSNWHPFRGEYFDFLGWLIIDDIDTQEGIEVDGLDAAVEEAAE